MISTIVDGLAQEIFHHASSKTGRLHDRSGGQIRLDMVERIVI